MTARLRKKTRRGATVLDALFLIGCAVVVVNIGLRVPDLIDYQYRRTCYQNQDLLDVELYTILEGERVEVYDVAAAYVYRSSRPEVPSRMIILKTPDEDGKWDDVVSREIPGSLLPRNLSCPVDSASDDALGVIDYAYIHGGWRCLYEPNHN